MARLDITLNGRAYAVACEDGQEQRLRELAAYVDARLREVSAGVVGTSEAHKLALATLMLADEIFDLRAEAGRGARPAPQPQAAQAEAGEEEAVVAAVDNLAKRIEDIAARLERA
ncbi:MAG TPA: cell division protein ZapA [Azospirillaceae bacterium]|nr:cell division protein ZapA [Azospirillaceae bacterium]